MFHSRLATAQKEAEEAVKKMEAEGKEVKTLTGEEMAARMMQGEKRDSRPSSKHVMEDVIRTPHINVTFCCFEKRPKVPSGLLLT